MHVRAVVLDCIVMVPTARNRRVNVRPDTFVWVDLHHPCPLVSILHRVHAQPVTIVLEVQSHHCNVLKELSVPSAVPRMSLAVVHVHQVAIVRQKGW